MSRIPPLSRLTSEEFKDQADWIERLLTPLNLFFERVTSALNKGLTVADNMAGAMKTVELNGTWPVKVAWELNLRPVSVLVGQVYRTDGASFVLANACQVQWQFNQSGQLQIDGVTGITPDSSNKFKVVLECKAG